MPRTFRINQVILCVATLCSAHALAQPTPNTLAITAPLAFEDFGSVKPGVIEVVSLADAPISADLKETILQEELHQKEMGWIRGSEEQTAVFDRAFSDDVLARGKPSVGAVAANLIVTPAQLEGTFLEGAETRAVLPSGAFHDGKWTGLTRMLVAPGIGRVILEESDYIASGAHLKIAEEVIDFYVGAYPGIFTVWRDRKNKGFTEVEWYTDRKQFRVTIDQQVEINSKIYENIIALANALN